MRIHAEQSGGEAEAEAKHIRRLYETHLRDSWSDGSRWYLQVYKPFDKAYAKDVDWYLYKGLDAVRRKLPTESIFLITREVRAEKCHINVLISTEVDLTKMHDKCTNKYKIYSQRCEDPLSSFHYIVKESRLRPFKKYLDYYIRNGCKEKDNSEKTEDI